MDAPTLVPQTDAAPMTWADVVAHPALQDLPFKIELNEWGQIVMSPASTDHSRLQGKFIRLLEAWLDGEAFPECPIQTDRGVKVADVVWGPDAFFEQHGEATPLRVAPPLCIEVRSPANTDAELREKVALYLAHGAQEVWICAPDGRLAFYGPDGLLPHSVLAPQAPARL